MFCNGYMYFCNVVYKGFSLLNLSNHFLLFCSYLSYLLPFGHCYMYILPDHVYFGHSVFCILSNISY